MFTHTTHQVNINEPQTTLDGGWVLDHISKGWDGHVASIYYTRGTYGSGEVMRVSDHWAGDTGISSIDGHDWSVGGESGTWRAGIASMEALEASGCYHWIAEAAPLTGAETVDELAEAAKNLLEAAKGSPYLKGRKLVSLHDRAFDAVEALLGDRDAAIKLIY